MTSKGKTSAKKGSAAGSKKSATKLKDAPKAKKPAAAKKTEAARKVAAAKKTAGAPDTATSGYLVLARRYRPMQFEQVVGQEHVTRTLQNAIGASRVHHAYLFTGSRGVGKTTVARIMAKALNCDPGSTAHPCDSCLSCTEIPQGRSVDVFEIDGASHTGVDDVRELRESVRYLPSRCRYKIYIIDEVHMLSTSAFNALLKTLEEPPPHVVFIFATTEPHRIPATILSRCQRFDFKRVPGPLMVEHLTWLCAQEGITVDRAGLSLIARASEGSVRDALSLLDQVIAFSAAEDGAISAARIADVLGVADRRILFEFSRAILRRDSRAALDVVEQLFINGQDLSQFARDFLGHLRDLAVVHTCRDPGELVDATEAELDELTRQASELPGAEILPQHFDHFARVTESIARSSFPRLLLEMAAIEMVHAEPVLPLGDLLQRLEGLEARLGGSIKGGGSPLKIPQVGSSAGHPPAQRARAVDTQKKDHSLTAAPSEKAPAPTAPGAPPVVSSDIEEGMGQWQSLLKRVAQQEPVAASAYAAGKLVDWTKDTIRLGYHPQSFELQWARDPKKLVAFEKECSRQAGRQLHVQIHELQPEDLASSEMKRISALEDKQQKQADRARSLRQEAESHPITRGFVETFGADIDSITTEVDDQ